MAARYEPWIALGGGGLAWTLHLFAAYFVVAVGCPRSWPVGSLLGVVTLVTAAVSLATALIGVRRWKRAADDDGGEARRLIFGASALLAGLFTIGILLGSLTALILSPCRGVGIG